MTNIVRDCNAGIRALDKGLNLTPSRDGEPLLIFISECKIALICHV